MEIVGTPFYMAPEQLRSSRDVDLRADIWSIGVVLYELTTARLPFEAESLPQLCTMVLSEAPIAPNQHRPEVPKGLSDAILRCLQRAPEDRFADVGELVTALAPFTPDWAPARAVLDVPRSSSSGGGRAVIMSPSGASSKTDAAWSETELAKGGRPWWKIPAIVVGSGLALVGAWNMGAHYVMHSLSQAPVESPVPSTRAPSPAVTPAPPSASPTDSSPTTPQPPPSASPTSAASVTVAVPSASVIRPQAVAPRKIAHPKSPETTDEEELNHR
jgi:eukaryotic-like serine/threonine-protein kinase